MRWAKTIIATAAALPLLALYWLPGRMAEDFVIHSLTNAAIKIFGLQVPEAERIISWAWAVMPFLAAVATLYLYHMAQMLFFSPTPLIREKSNVTRWQSFVLATKPVVAISTLIFFVGAVLYTGYHDDHSAGPVRFREIAHLSNYELRERAFTVSHELRVLSQQYNERLKTIPAAYDSEKPKYDEQGTQYETDEAEYRKAKAACPFGYTYDFPTTALLNEPQASSPTANLPLYSSPSIFGTSKPCALPDAPTPPSPHSFPIYGVDPQASPHFFRLVSIS
jgi:hypothetical protein